MGNEAVWGLLLVFLAAGGFIGYFAIGDPNDKVIVPQTSCVDICIDLNYGWIPNNPVGLAENGSRAYIYPPEYSSEVDVYCDCRDGVAWTVFQRRMDGSEDFYRESYDYRNGFGETCGEFWLGLSKLQALAGNSAKLRIDLEDWTGNRTYAEYSNFAVIYRNYVYTLYVSGYSGNAGDSLTYHNGKSFSTRDDDNDGCECSCSNTYNGAWWFDDCYESHLNGPYLDGPDTEFPIYGIIWKSWLGAEYSLKSVEMKFTV